MANCANRGTPTGGDKDTTPPVITASFPDNYSTDFTAKEIKIHFDEYVKINNLQKQLIISPPMDPEPEITPLGAASKYITIKIFDTLQPNTTYAFNFGESIVDNNEGNPYPYYRYVFSTGEFIDSLSVSGNITDALDHKPEEFVSVLLYDVDSTFTDSIIYKEKPKYITNTLDSTSTFQLENLKAGKYLMIALKDDNSNYTFQQKLDKIGFVKNYITVPSDTIYNIKLFKEIVDFKASRARQISGNKLAFGYEGDAENMKIKLLSQVPEDIVTQTTKDPQNDTLFYWYHPKIEADSLVFEINNGNYADTLTVKIRDRQIDSLVFSPIQSRVLKTDEDFELEANVPFQNIDTSKITILDKDSTVVSFSSSLDTLKNRARFKFDKEAENRYNFQMLPETLTDFFGRKNEDTLTYQFTTKALSDYGNIRLTLINAVYPVIVQLIDEQGKIKAEKYSVRPELLDFRFLEPRRYYIRVIFDTNNNRKYDTGSFLLKRQPERVSYFPQLLDVRAGWDYIEEFNLLD